MGRESSALNTFVYSFLQLCPVNFLNQVPSLQNNIALWSDIRSTQDISQHQHQHHSSQVMGLCSILHPTGSQTVTP